MNCSGRWLGVLLFGWALISAGSAEAQFFTGAPTTNANTTSGVLVNTLVVTPNNVTFELDVTGQLIVNNPTPSTPNTLTFTTYCNLDPTYNSGFSVPNFVLQISQSGFVDVPLTGNIGGWSLLASIVDASGVGVGSASAGMGPFGPGLGQTYGPTTNFGTPFTYSPAGANTLRLDFTSPFFVTGSASQFVWDFPISVKFSVVPEPTSVGLVAAAALTLVGIRRRRCLAARRLA